MEVVDLVMLPVSTGADLGLKNWTGPGTRVKFSLLFSFAKAHLKIKYERFFHVIVTSY